MQSLPQIKQIRNDVYRLRIEGFTIEGVSVFVTFADIRCHSCSCGLNPIPLNKS